MYSTSSLVLILNVYNIKLPDNLVVIPKKFKGFKELSEYLRKQDLKNVAEKIESHIGLLSEALLLQEVEYNFSVKLPDFPITKLRENQTYEEQSFLRLLICPIKLAKMGDVKLTLKEAFKDPITLPNGETYERELFVEAWKKKHKEKPIPSGFLVRNILVKQLVEELQEKKEVKSVNFTELFEDPLKFVPFDKDMVIDSNGHTFKSSSIKEWLEISNVCPNNPDLPCVLAQLRPNNLLELIHQYYVKHLKPKPDPLKGLLKVADYITKISLKKRFNSFFNALNYLFAPDDGLKFLEQLEYVVDNLNFLLSFVTSPQNVLAMCRSGLSDKGALDSLIFIHGEIKRLVKYNEVLLNLKACERGRGQISHAFLVKLEMFFNNVKFQQRYLDPKDSLVYAKIIPNTKSKVSALAVYFGGFEGKNSKFDIVLTTKNQNAKKVEAIAKLIAEASRSKVSANLYPTYRQFRFNTKNIGVVLLAFLHLKLIDKHELGKLKRAFGNSIKNLDKLRSYCSVKKMLKNVDKVTNPVNWLQKLVFFKEEKERSHTSLDNTHVNYKAWHLI